MTRPYPRAENFTSLIADITDPKPIMKTDMARDKEGYFFKMMISEPSVNSTVSLRIAENIGILTNVKAISPVTTFNHEATAQGIKRIINFRSSRISGITPVK
mmetsp:Transcript_3335/g.5844  ORF Transcript_3335/g.5844 Transcript_3335/m.5844 type:complete len:102 (+) Transcript_3335:615-920(+)